jgi:RND family efflux transporter MFP subunit
MRHLLLSIWFALFLFGPLAPPVRAEPFTVRAESVTDFRPVIARIEASDTVLAKARISGTVTALSLDEGKLVKRGERLALIVDTTLPPQINALSARASSLQAQLKRSEDDRTRARKLHADGFFPRARLDALENDVTSARQNLASAQAERQALIARRDEGAVLAPVDAIATEVLVVQGTVVSAGEIIARFASSDGIVRLSLPERHAGAVKVGEAVQLSLPSRGGEVRTASIVQVYPQLRDGAVIADARVEGGLDALVGERVDVLVPVGVRTAILIPQSHVSTRFGIDFVSVKVSETMTIQTPVVLASGRADSRGRVEVLSGLRPGDVVVTP